MLPKPKRESAVTLPMSDIEFWDLGNNRGIVRMRNGGLVFVDTRDQSLASPIRSSGEWEPQVARVLLRFLRPGATVVEVGSNIGCHTLTMALAIGRSGSMLAIEANPDVAELLQCTVAINSLRQVRLVNAAVMDRPGETTIFATETNLGGGAVGLPGWESDPGLSQHKRHVVQAVTLDSLTADLAGVDLIRMDVEGCELAVLAGAQQLLSRSPRVKIVCEWGAYHAPSYFGMAEGLDALMARGFRFWRIEPDGALTPQSRAQMLERQFCEVVIAAELD
jgi:FkbM family methyltransferase